MHRFIWTVLAFCVATFAVSTLNAGAGQRRLGTVSVSDLPKEARQTIALIKKGGPYPYKRDGIVFGNFEKRLPPQPRGYYHEYTVATPGSRDRGTRRIISGKAGELFYTDDHYETFRRVIE